MSPENHLEPFDDWQLFQQCPENENDLESKTVLGKRTRRSFPKNSQIPPINIKSEPYKFVQTRQSIVIRTLENGEISHDRKHSTEVHGELEDIPEIPANDPETIPYGKSRHLRTTIKPAA